MNTWISFASFSDELHKIATDKRVPLDKAETKLFNTLMRGAPVKVKITPDAANYGGGYFDQVNKEIGISEKSYSNLAHELGHAELDKHILGRLIQSRVSRLMGSGSLNLLSGIGAGLLMAKGQKWGVLLPAALAAPTLLSEGLATHKGGKLLDEAGATKEQRKKYDTSMLKGFGSYLLSPSLATVVAVINSTASRAS